ncbi:MAG: penicillin-binding protein 1A, partial [Desulfobacterales bacterium]|nr:penicillin-binding protein 1A [Desulfobacterales bacterium]
IVLRQMRLTDIISRDQYDAAVNAPLKLAEKKARSIQASYFVDYVKRLLENEETIGSSALYKGGLSIHTTLSSKLQGAAESAMANGLDVLEKRMSKRMKKRMKKQDLKKASPEGALIALDVASGGVLAMVGGRNFSRRSFNRATSARRQPGSAFKPILYAHAIERGFAQHQTLLDAPVVFKGADNGKDWKPENYYKNYRGEMTMREALAHSRNIPAVRLMEKLGPSSVAEFAHVLGVESPLSPNLSLALGSSVVTLTELTAAYAAFANHGNRIKPFAILEVVDARGRVIWRAKPEKTIAMSRAGAAIITDMLQGVIQSGTGKKARTLKRPLAGKTGTTNQCRDALFIGYSPDVAAGVWVGRDDYGILGARETGASAALPIWIEFMRAALSNRSPSYFDIPDDVSRVSIDPVTGKPLPENDPRAVPALFKKGTEP